MVIFYKFKINYFSNSFGFNYFKPLKNEFYSMMNLDEMEMSNEGNFSTSFHIIHLEAINSP